MNTKREQFVRQAASLLVEGLNAGRITFAPGFIDAIQSSLDPEAPWIWKISHACQYYIDGLSAGQRRALAKSIAGAVANHPDRPTS